MSNNKSILVISADGFIGSHLTEKLVRNDYIVKASIQYNSFILWGWLDHCSKDLKEDFEVVACDEFLFHKLLKKIVMIFNSNLELISI